MPRAAQAGMAVKVIICHLSISAGSEEQGAGGKVQRVEVKV
jgi:hypothetical protein